MAPVRTTSSALAALLLALAVPVAAAEERHRFAPLADRPRRVAFLVSEGATLIDFAGPWEVFQDVMVDAAGKPVTSPAQLGPGSTARHPFTLYTVAATRQPIRVSGGLEVVPDHAFADAPPPDVIVVGANRPSPEALAWLGKASAGAGMTMAV